MGISAHGAMRMFHAHVLKMLRQVPSMLAIGTAFLDTLSRRPWNRPPDLHSLEGDPDGSYDF